MNEFFEALKDGLEDLMVPTKGKKTLRSNLIELPSPPYKYSAKDIKRMRKKSNYSQSIFAMILNVSTKTVQAWESGERLPNGASLRLLEIIDNGLYGKSPKKRHLKNQKSKKTSQKIAQK